MPRSSTLRPRCISKAESIRSFFRAARARGPATYSPASRSTWRRARLVSATEAARMLPTSTTSSNRKIPRSTAWTAPFAPSSSFCTGLRKRTRRERHLFPHRRRQSCWRQSKLSSAAHFANLADDRFPPAGLGSWYPDAAIFCKRALGFHRPKAEIVAVLLEEKLIAGSHPQRTPHFDRHCDLALLVIFACIFIASF